MKRTIQLLDSLPTELLVRLLPSAPYHPLRLPASSSDQTGFPIKRIIICLFNKIIIQLYQLVVFHIDPILVVGRDAPDLR